MITKNDLKKNNKIETGYFEDGIPFAKMGNQPNILLVLEGLSYNHKPPSKFVLRYFKKSYTQFLDEYTIINVGRRPNLPEYYLMEHMADDYAQLIKKEFNMPVDILGTSTGGQIAQFLAANHPEYVRKLIIISAAYKLSEKGVDIERRAAEYFDQGKIGKSLGTIMEMMYEGGIMQKFLKFFMRLFGGFIYGDIEYPNDFLIEVRADREMNFKNRLGDIEAPTLILIGEDDIGYSIDDVKETAAGIPHAKLIIYEGYGHNLTMRNDEEVMQQVKEFLSE